MEGVEQTVADNARTVEQVSEDDVNGTKSEAAVVDKESIISTTASPAVTSTSSIISTTASPAVTSTMTSTMTMTSAMTTSKAKQIRMLQVKSGAGWSFKDTVLGLHLGMGLWLLILTGGAMYFGGAISLLWVRLEALQRQRARFPPPPPAVDA